MDHEMSDDWIVLVPEDPRFVPSPRTQFAAKCRFAEMAPNADAVDILDEGKKRELEELLGTRLIVVYQHV